MSYFKFHSLLLLTALVASLAPAAFAEQKPSDSSALIRWLLEEERDLKGILFGEVLEASSGKRIHRIDKAADAPWLDKLSTVLNQTLAAINNPSHPIHTAPRINEASRFIEDQLLVEINTVPGWTSSIPKTADGKEQRSGYPDIRLELEDGSIVYLDPKLFARNSRNSSFRTFYFEPKTTTGKVQDDARHLLIGVAHNSGEGGSLQFESWDIADVSRLKVQLKAEFQASNRDLYSDDTVIRSASPIASSQD